MVCSRGKNLTTYIKQMKLITAIASAAVIGASFLVPNPANSEINIGWSESDLMTKEKIKGIIDNPAVPYAGRSGSACPPGTRNYRTKGLFGLGARDIGCMTAYEAESLRRQQAQNVQRNFQRNRMRNCTTNFIGRTAYTNCY